MHSGRHASGELHGPCPPSAISQRCWTDSSQGATLMQHHLHRHGVGRGAVSKLPGVSDRCRARLLRHRVDLVPQQSLRVSRAACAAATQRAGIGARPQDPFNAIVFACLAALGQPGRRIPQARSFDINKPSLATSPNSKALPRRHIEAALDQRSHLMPTAWPASVASRCA